MSAPTFAALAREVLDSFPGAWWHPWESPQNHEQWRELHHPTGWTTIVKIVVRAADDGRVWMVAEHANVTFGHATPAKQAAQQLREHLDWYLARPVDPSLLTRGFWTAMDKSTAHASEEANRLADLHQLPAAEGDPTFVDADEGDALRALIFATQDKYRALAGPPSGEGQRAVIV